jgi:dTDP-4-dehydrorhamnose 3,5-epimerase
MEFKNGSINGVVIKELVPHHDHRGWLIELFRNDEVATAFLPAMSYISSTNPGIARGPHEHREQADMFCFVGPSTFRLYMWDARKHSPTYGTKMVIDVGEAKPTSVIVPAGVIHAYKNIGSVDGWVLNFPNRLYAGRERKEPVDEIRHEGDPNTIFQLD